MSGKKRIFAISLTLIILLVVVTVVSIRLLYETAFDIQRERLVEIAKNQATLIEAISRYDKQTESYLLKENESFNPTEATLSQLKEAHTRFKGFGKTGEFTLAKKENNYIVFILKHRHNHEKYTDYPEYADAVPLDSNLAEPMKLALQGESGTLIGRDYRGEIVLAAYEPIKELNWGVVAKIDLDEIRVPYIKVGFLSAAVMFLLIIVGFLIILKLGSPLVMDLKKSEEKYRELIESTDNLVTKVDSDGIFTFVNNGSNKFFGLPPEECIGLSAFEFVHPDEREYTKNEFKKWVKEKPAIITFENRQMSRSGEIRDVLWTCNFIYDKRGNIKELNSIAKDITQIKKTDRLIHEVNELNMAVIENSPLGISIRTNKGKLLSVNKEWQKIWGVSDETLQEYYALNPPKLSFDNKDKYLGDWLPKIKKIYEEGGLIHIPEIYLNNHRSSRPRWVSQTFYALYDHKNNVDKVVIITNDITERKKTEDILRKKEIEYQKAQAIGNVGSFSIDIATGKHIWSNQIYTILGLEPGEIEPRSIALNDFIHPEDKIEFEENTRKIYGKNKNMDFTYRIIKKTGEIRYVHTQAELEFDKSGKPVSIYGYTQDITEKVKAEKDLRKSEAHNRTVVENIKDVIYTLSSDGTITTLSPSFEEITGFKISEFVGKSFMEIIHPEDRKCAADVFSKILQNRKSGVHELRVITKSGDIITGEFRENTIYENGQLVEILGVARDVTERKMAQKALEQSEDRFKKLFYNAPVGYQSLDVNGDFIEVNDTWCRILGYDKDEVIGKNFSDFMVPSYIGLYKHCFPKFKAEGVIDDAEFELIKKNGSVITATFNGKISYDENGNFKQTHCVFTDITAKKQMENAINRFIEISSKQYGQQLYDEIVLELNKTLKTNYALIGILKDNDDKYVKTVSMCHKKEIIENIEFCLSGTPCDNVVDSGICTYPENVASIFPEDTMLKDMKIESYIGIPLYGYNKKPMGIMVALSTASLKDESFARSVMQIYANRISTELQRNKAEESLQRSEDNLKLAFNQAGDALYLINTSGNLSDINDQACGDLGYSKKELLNLPISSIDSNLTQETLNNYFVHLKPGSPITVESIHKRKDHSEFPVEIRIGLIETQGQSMLVALARDISDRKMMEEEFIKTEKLESIGVLAGGIAHDFNNILTGITGNISLAKSEINEADDSYLCLKDAEFALDRARDLTQQLLTFSKGGSPVRKTSSISDLLEKSSRFVLSGSNVKCKISLSDNLDNALIDEGQINQVINNILINAMHAMPDGGTIHINCKNHKVKNSDTIKLKPGNYVKISLRDQGVGIPEENINKIFDPFFTTKQKGNGLGLASAYSIIKKHGGLIECYSELGIGTEFIIYLPASGNPINRKMKIDKDNCHGHGYVLVMDDEQIIRNIAEKTLTRAGYEIELASDGHEAIDKYINSLKNKKPFDIVILDLTIPGGMGGVETLKELRKINKNVKTIVSSGYSNNPTLSDFDDQGFSGIVKKPYKPSELIHCVKQIIETGKCGLISS